MIKKILEELEPQKAIKTTFGNKKTKKTQIVLPKSLFWDNNNLKPELPTLLGSELCPHPRTFFRQLIHNNSTFRFRIFYTLDVFQRLEWGLIKPKTGSNRAHNTATKLSDLFDCLSFLMYFEVFGEL